MATIFGNLSGYTLTGFGTSGGGSPTVPGNEAWVAFYQGGSSPPGMTNMGTNTWVGLFLGGSTGPSVAIAYLIFTPIPSINAL